MTVKQKLIEELARKLHLRAVTRADMRLCEPSSNDEWNLIEQLGRLEADIERLQEALKFIDNSAELPDNVIPLRRKGA